MIVYLLLGRKNLTEGDAGEQDKWQGDQGYFDHPALFHCQAVLHVLLIPPLPLHHLVLLIILLLPLLLILLLFLIILILFFIKLLL